MDLVALVVVDLEPLQPPREGLPTRVGVEGFMVALALEPAVGEAGNVSVVLGTEGPAVFFHLRYGFQPTPC